MFLKKTYAKAFTLLFLLAACAPKEKEAALYVNPFVGTGGHGHTYPGAVVPHGLVQLSPDTRLAGWDACGGYYYDDPSIIGFSHTHLSGTGIGDYGDFLFLPFTGELRVMPPNGEDSKGHPGSRFSHDKEKACPGYYSVVLQDYGIEAELTASRHAGFHQYTFPQSDAPGMLIDLSTGVQERRVLDADFKLLGDTAIEGMKHIRGWALDRYAYFYARFSKPFTCEVEDGGRRALLSFGQTKEGEVIQVKVGISFVDNDGAKNNLEKEIPLWDFDAVRSSAAQEWNDALSVISVKTADEEAKAIFYTSLYHSLLEPTVSSDVDGRYRTMENEIAVDKDYVNYTVFSLWDTFRALNPLLTIAYPSTEEALIRSLIRKYDEGGILPMWELASNYTGTMLGYHAVPLIVDAYVKGLRDFDVEKAYEACVFSSSYDTVNVSPTINRGILHRDLMSVGKQYKNTTGYIPSDKVNQSVAKGLEYAYNDWLIAQFAKGLGKDDDYACYTELGKNYVHYFDASTGFMRGKLEDGTWREPFVPNASDHGYSDYCEGNAWQWAWFVPHDVEGLVGLMGGREAFVSKLDSLFTAGSELVGDNVSADISGMIGQYAHGNEPSHQTVHLYNLVDRPRQTQELVDSILYTLYSNSPDGISGNEDCGQMSAWYILNAMGFYSYCPGIAEYSVGRPIFDEVSIRLENGRTFVIKTVNNTRANKYIESLSLNGRKLDRPFFSHSDLEAGGTLEIRMTGNRPTNQ
ncbi:MAG: GH92 family glycosyl hydrolase [Tannerellaceae bacterium]|jgi:predicted alpha-1,2-mannosidase|nr:GH92 family glycosyl hydrolase [Tannerellaceae bacterium]